MPHDSSAPLHQASASTMVDLTGLHARMRPALDAAMARVMESSAFIKGSEVAQFEARLETVMNLGGAAIGCGNGTDALTLALMALGVGPGDEVIVPDFSFISTAETVALRGAIPVFVDIDPRTFQLDLSSAQRAISPRTKAVVPVHLFGQCADMQPLMTWALEHGLKVIEDNAQSLGATCHGASGLAAGTVGHLGTTSFFPSKNLGCMGDGGAVLVGQATPAEERAALAETVRRLANHGASRKYHHVAVGINSRLDALQAAFLDVKLDHWSAMIEARQEAASRYDTLLAERNETRHWTVEPPLRTAASDHLFHQYCVLLPKGTDRDALQSALREAGVASMVYYPTPLSSQPAFHGIGRVVDGGTPVAHDVADRILALPMHTELTPTIQTQVIDELCRLLPSTQPNRPSGDA